MNTASEVQEVKLVGVIGGGNIGSTLVVDLLLHHIPVVLVDVSEEILLTIKEKLQRELMLAPMMNKKITPIDLNEIDNLLVLTTDLEKVSDCDLIIENVPEEWPIKKELYPKLDSICKPEACFGVNTSCIPIGKIAALTNRPKKIVGVHFMNPVYLKDTVEVIQGKATSYQTISVLQSLLQMLHKDAVLVNDNPGFVSNRISHLFMNEAAFVFQDEVADAVAIDKIFRNCFNHNMGPLETADLIGIDTVVKSIDVLYDNFKDPKFKCCPLLREMVAAGKLGRKTGEGFYKY